MSKKKSLAIIGASGRMGSELRSLVGDCGFVVSQAVSRQTVENIKTVSSVENLSPKSLSVVIDFSLPTLTEEVAAWCGKNKIPLVSGVTGLGAKHRAALNKASKTTPVLWAANMSLGIAVMSRMLREFSRLEGFDFQVEEIHHKNKKDRPSGTALLLQEKLTKSIRKSAPAPVSIRGGGVFGVHRVFALGAEETLMLEHSAINRRVFARGALKAADWLMSQKPGFYTIDDVIE